MLTIHQQAERPIFVRQNNNSSAVGHRMRNIEIVVNYVPVSPEQRQQ